MKFESQRVAWWFFATCMLLFGLQLVYGLIMGFAHAGHDRCTTSSRSTSPARSTPTCWWCGC
jgi:hypothetical protein